MRTVATRGRWIWGLSGMVTTVALVVPGILLITSAGQAENAQPQSTATQTVTVPQPVTSLSVQSYGAPVQVTAGPVRHVQITETLMYDAQAGHLPARLAKAGDSGRVVPCGTSGPPASAG
jgi:hypothetical protein